MGTDSRSVVLRVLIWVPIAVLGILLVALLLGGGMAAWMMVTGNCPMMTTAGAGMTGTPIR